MVGCSEGGDRHLSGPDPTVPGPGPWEKSQDGSRMAPGITIVEVVGSGIIEIDCDLDQAQSQDARVEVDVALRIACNRSYMVDSQDRVLHYPLPQFCRCPCISFRALK